MNAIPYDGFCLIANWLTIKEIEKLFYTGNKRIIMFSSKYPVIDPVNVRVNGLGRLFMRNATLTHYKEIGNTDIILPRYTERLSVADATLSKFRINCYNDIKNATFINCVMDHPLNWTKLEDLTITNLIYGPLYLPENLKKITVVAHQLLKYKFPKSIEYIDLSETNKFQPNTLYLDDFASYTALNTLKLSLVNIPDDLFKLLPNCITSLALILKEKQLGNPLDFEQCKLPLQSLYIDCKAINLDKLPQSLTRLVIHNDSISQMADLSVLPKLLVLHDLHEKKLDTIPHDYATLPSSLLDLNLSDRHIDIIELHVIMQTLPKLSRFVFNVSIPGYKYISKLFEQYLKNRYLSKFKA